MICPKCGRNIPDGSVCPCSYNTPVLSSNPAVNTLKTIGSSPLFLVVSILLSITPVLTIASQLGLRDNVWDLFYYAMQLDLDPSLFYPVIDAASSMSVAGAVLSAVPAILIAVAMWITYASCRDTQSGNVSTAGLTICKVLSIISLVCICIFAAILVLFMVILLIAGVAEAANDVYGYDASIAQAGIAVLLVLFVILAAVLALAIIYQVCVIKTINRIKATATTGVPDNRIPNFLVVMNYIEAASMVLAGLANLFTTPVLGLGSLVGAATLVIIAIILTRYRSGMTLLMYPPVQPVYPQQPMPPQGPGNPWG